MKPLTEGWINKAEGDCATAQRELNAYAIVYRYPGDSADREIARRALAACRNARQTLFNEIVTQWVNAR
ncbi:MAG: hypothetical protein ACOX2W_09500 [Desulfomonilia bacterium]